MRSYNLALLSNEERRDIELSRMAALLIYKLKKGKITRAKVTSELNGLDISEQEKFKDYLNKYKSMK
tara:strand:+ start:1052 stop:1252 length:201 start_codon:yes stop_codon:yes gene_type:complete